MTPRSGPTTGPLLGVLAAVVIGVGGGYYLVAYAFTANVRNLVTDGSGPLWLTLRVAVLSVVVGGGLGIAVGYALAKGRFRGRDLIEALGSVPIILPPTVLGYYLLTNLGDTWLGRATATVLGRPAIFTVQGCVIVGSIVGFPYAMRAARTAVEGVDPRLEQAARTMGMSELRVALRVTLPLARRGIGVGLTFGFLRALGEYGATLMVGGAILGHTRTLSIAVLDQPSVADTHAVLLVLVVLAVLALALVARLQMTPR